jgi:formin 2
MTEMIAKSEDDYKELKELLEECTKSFVECMKFYKFSPKKGKVEDAKPEEFFSIWYPFCDDYKNIWKKEQVCSDRNCFDVRVASRLMEPDPAI